MTQPSNTPAECSAYFERTTNMQITLRNVRLAFPELWEPKQVNGEGKPAFSATFLLTPDNPGVKELLDACREVANEKWGAKAAAVFDYLKEEKKLAIKNGNSKPDYAGFPGNYFVSARSANRPHVADRKKGSVLTAADGRPYAGCYVNGYIELWAQDNNYGKRINASLRAVQFVKDGDSFTGAKPISPDEIEDLGVDEDAPEDLV